MMSTQIPWILPLGLKPEEVEHWKMQINPGTNLTFWALSKGLLNWSPYQQWAMDYYQLPAVNDDYFREPASVEFWKLIQSVANWSPNLLPLEQWDGTVFIGCVEPPPADVTWSFPVQFVLASPTSLKLQWQKYNQQPLAAAAAPIPDGPAEIVLTPPPVAEVSLTAPSTSDTFQLNIDIPPNENEEAPPLPAPEMPDGLSFDVGGVKKVELSFDVEVPAGPSTPEGMINQLETADTTSAHEPVLSDLPGNLDITAVTTMPAEPQAPVPVIAQAPATPPVAATTKPATPQLSLKDVQTEEQAMLWAFNEMKKFFDQSMFLKFENNEFHPLHWSEGWQPKPGVEQLKIGIDTPNLFRIIARTKHVYHGKLVPSPSHQIFFQNWGLVQIPDMATAIPVTLHGTLKGVLLSVGPESSIEGQALEHAEKIASRLALKWDELTNPGGGKAA